MMCILHKCAQVHTHSHSCVQYMYGNAVVDVHALTKSLHGVAKDGGISLRVDAGRSLDRSVPSLLVNIQLSHLGGHLVCWSGLGGWRGLGRSGRGWSLGLLVTSGRWLLIASCFGRKEVKEMCEYHDQSMKVKLVEKHLTRYSVTCTCSTIFQ